MELEDFSHLRAAEGATVTIPLNGQKYHCVAEVAANMVLDAVTDGVAAAQDLQELPEGTTLDQLAEKNPALAAKLAAGGGSQFEKAMTFMREVLEPESWQRWVANMAPPPAKATPGKRQQHLAKMITVPQLLAVYRSLIRHYCGRPTAASSSSQNGAGATGGTSTGGAPPEA